MRGHRQGMMISGQHDYGYYGESMALYDYGESMALYDYSGLGVDLGNPLTGVLDRAGEIVDGVPTWAKALGLVAAGLGVYAVASGKVKLGKKKSRSNPRRRRLRRRRRRRLRRNRR